MICFNTKNLILGFSVLTLLIVCACFPFPVLAGGLVKPANNLGLVGWWTLDEGIGTIAHDFSGNNKNGQMVGTPLWDSGKKGKSLNFDSAGNQMIDLGDNFDFPSGVFSLCAWAYPTDDGNDGYIAGKFTGGNGWWLRRFSDPPNAGNWQGDVNTNNNLTITGGARVNTWSHLCLVVNPGPGTSVLYHNGIAGATSTSLPTYSDNSTSAVIGNRSDSARDFAGKIDDVRIYNRAISANDVQKLYQSGQVALKQVTNRGLMGWWTFDEGTSTISHDSSGNNNVMSNVNMESTDWFPGKRGKALDFDGVNEYGLVNGLTVPTEGTFSAWVTSDFDEATCCSSFPMLFVSSDPRTSVWYNGTSDAYILSTNGSFTNRATYTVPGDLVGWFHIAVTWSASGSQFYKDGVPVGTPGTGDNSGASGSTFYLGTRPAFDRWWDGKMDDVHLYNRVLSASEIMSLYKTGEQVAGRTQSDRVSEGLIGYWSFNGQDISWPSNLVYDRSGNGYNGTMVNMNKATSVVPGKSGQALNFNGINNQITIPSVSLFDFSGTSYSISLWTNLKANQSGWAGIISKGIAANNWAIQRDSNTSSLSVFHQNNAVTFSGLWGLLAGTGWNHLVISYNTTSNTVTAYLNGVSQGTGSGSMAGDPVYDGSYPIKIGSSRDDISISGNLDEVRVYNRIITPTEAKQLYNLGR